MTDEATEPAEPSPRARIAPSVRRGWDLLPLLYLVGFLVLAGSLFYLYRHPQTAQLPPQEASRIGTLQTQVQALSDQVSALQNRPAAVVAGGDDTAKLQERVAALESRPAAAGAPARGAAAGGEAPSADAGLAERVQKLEARPAPDLAPLAGRIEALEKRPPVDLGPVNARLDQLAAQGRDAAAQVGARLGPIEARLGAVEGEAKQGLAEARQGAAQARQTAAALDAINRRTQLAARLQGASAALAAGQKLGDVPGAPPALARFANEAPPTEAGLRLSFDRYADAAQKASQPAVMDNKDFGARLWNRAQQVVTVRQGDRVLLGDPIAGVVAHAREQLDAGDLGGAVRALEGLAGPAAEAMKPWTDQARALLDARAAIASMAAG